ncbi:hypothetical protein LTR56_011629 [Elasticomyces elasticus]|nr:hypothetical protein LTR56_011629 [Elasticomyces elasticus]KAK3647964.1 hypothetical protein LTR22_013577 [Elasticomyces elasticus]KAK4905335.1 hypothetical protein LTR49_025358 [Elasticomyces elasticus]KAK5765337.1 hypothetical protein LTS12_004594 [Elasticomyces elasticus]
MAAAVQSVFDIAELFDTIMLYVSPQQLFVNIRVCKGWSNYITRSKALQIHMFLLPGPATSSYKDVELNPWRHMLVDAYGPKNMPTKKYLNPLFKKDARLKTGWASPESSLRKTLLARPAVKDAKLSAMITIGCASMWPLQNGFGCTLGALESVIRGLIKGLDEEERFNEEFKEEEGDGEESDEDEKEEWEKEEWESDEDGGYYRWVSSCSVYSTRVYGDGIWRGDDKIRREGEKGRALG